MKQRAHAWVALRALKLIDDLNKVPKFVELMSYYLSDAWEGAWLPDTLIRDVSYGHYFKMDDSPEFADHSWRKKSYTELNRELTGKRLCLDYIKDSEVLKKPYWVHASTSGNLPDRVIAISHSLGDMLKMSDYPMAFYVKKKRSKAYRTEDLSAMNVKDLTLSPNFSARQIAMMLFVISHYICDAHMPLHCDYRDYGSGSKRLSKKLHPSIEEKWEEHFPEKEDVILHDYVKKSVDDVVMKKMPPHSIIEIDKVERYKLSNRLSRIKGNEWDEMVNICRTSLAVSRKWIKEEYETGSDFNAVEFKDVTNRIFHDAVESVARIWFKAWERFAK